MAGGAAEVNLGTIILEWAWAIIGVLMTVIWKRHTQEIADLKNSIERVGEEMAENMRALDHKIQTVEREHVTVVAYERNREEVMEGQREIFNRLDKMGQSLARIEGKLDR